MVSHTHEAVGNTVDRIIQAADYIIDLLTLNDPVQMTLQGSTYRVTMVEEAFFDKMYDMTNKGRNN
jgi:hypothetical protein